MDPSHPGHGEEYILGRKVAGKTVAAHFRSGPALDRAQREVANCKCFRGLVHEMVEVNEQVCEASPVAALVADQPPAGIESKKGGSCRQPPQRSLGVGLGPVELAVRTAMVKLGGGLLEGRLGGAPQGRRRALAHGATVAALELLEERAATEVKSQAELYASAAAMT